MNVVGSLRQVNGNRIARAKVMNRPRALSGGAIANRLTELLL